MYDAIPQELRKLQQWVCWNAIPDETRPGKIKKVPVNPKTGGQAQSNNAETWADFKTACAAAAQFSGIGFMFANGYFGIDIDGEADAIDDYRHGDMENIIAEFIHTMQSYSEYSVSGNGIHIICRGSLPPAGRRKNNVEMYQNGRFFVVTGNPCAEYAEIADCTQTIKNLHEKYIGGGSAPTTGIKKSEPLDLTETQVIEMAQKSKQGKLFSDLYAGNFQQYYKSPSEADMAFCNMLAFWCRRDEQLMDRIFRSSGLMREKWTRRQNGTTYGAITIGKAARECRTVYEPKPEYAIRIGTPPPPKPAEPKKLYTFDDTGNAERFADTFGQTVKYNYTSKKWMYYDGRKWCYDMIGETKRMVDEIVEEMRHGLDEYIDNAPPEIDIDDAEKQYVKHIKQSRSNKSKVAMLKESEHRMPVMPSDLDKHISLFNTTNGALDLRSGNLLPHDKQHLLTKISHTEYTDKIDCPLWDSFLNDIFAGDRLLIRYIQKAVGYSLTGSTQEQCAFFCYGTGRNGKSTFLDIIGDVMGDYATNIQPETLMVRPNTGGPTSDIARLKGARFVTTVEPNEGARLNEGLLKQLTGGDRVTASKKYEDEFEFTPEFKLWMGTNHKPVIRGTDTGIWRRIQLIPFTVQIPEDKVDKRLKHKLRAELSAILSWAVDGCLLWQKEGLKPPKSVEDASKEYKGEMDVLATFLDECTAPGGEVGATELFKAYLHWAHEANEYEMSSTKFGREMAKRYEKNRRNIGMFYMGVHILTHAKPYQVKFANNV